MKYYLIMVLVSFLSIIAMEKEAPDVACYAYVSEEIKNGTGALAVKNFVERTGIKKDILVDNSKGSFCTNWVHLLAAYGACNYEMKHHNNSTVDDEWIPIIEEELVSTYFDALDETIVSDYVVFDYIKTPSICPEQKVFDRHTIPFCLLTRGYATLANTLFEKGFYLTPLEFDYLVDQKEIANDILIKGITQAIEYFYWRQYDPRYEYDNIWIPLYNQAVQSIGKLGLVV